MKKTTCPYCMDDKEVKVVSLTEVIPVREDMVQVSTEVLVCQSCFGNFNDKDVPSKALEEAFKAYRKSHNLLNPEEIKYWRFAYNYSLMEVSYKTGITPERLALIEGGALQEKPEDYELQKVFGLR